MTNLFVDNVVTPFFAKRAMKISFLELTLSLVGWSFLLGVAEAIIAIPLTLALKDQVKQRLSPVKCLNSVCAVRIDEITEKGKTILDPVFYAECQRYL